MLSRLQISSVRRLLLLFITTGLIHTTYARPNGIPASPGAPNHHPLSGPAGLPILPSPHHTKQYNTPYAFHPATIQWIGLDQPTRQRLQPHWENLHPTPSLSQVPLQAGILGKDPAFDHLVATTLATSSPITTATTAPLNEGNSTPSWPDSIGNQGYILLLSATHCLLAARSDTGLFYGLQSLKQLIRSHWDRVIFIADWPSFTCRAIYDDISRGPISTVAYIKQQIERMAEIKINYLSFYIEHIVQPISHPDFAPPDGKLTITQIKELSDYAAKYYMQLIGSFQSFGHFEKILAQPVYSSLGATSTLISPTEPRARDFLRDVIGELCDAFSAPWFNVNCDETFDLGQGLTKPYVDSIGAAAFYAAHLRFLHDIVNSHGKKMMVWGDFVLQHPETLDLLPKDITWLTWEYGDQHSFDNWIRPFADRHLSFMVCPGILNTYRLFPDMLMAKANITHFAAQGARTGASGVLTTIWDDGSAYLFSGDWYGVYVSAESSWSALPIQTTTSTFDHRYALNAYGPNNDNYVHALYTLMLLKQLPLTYNLNESIWLQHLLPDSGTALILNNRSADTALALLEKAAIQLARTKPSRNATDIRTLSFAIDQYRLLIRSRQLITRVATLYKKYSLDDTHQLSTCIRIIDSLRSQYRILQKRFTTAWLTENQLYWLDKAQQPYTLRINQLDQLSAHLTRIKGTTLTRQPLPPPAAIGLDIRESACDYFQGWMLAGPFPAGKTTTFLPFLYSDNTSYNKPPSPGDFTQYQGKMYRWKKYFSDRGGIIDPTDIQSITPTAATTPAGQATKPTTPAGPTFFYAYCQIIADTTTTINAFIETTQPIEVFCNGAATPPGSLPVTNSKPPNLDPATPFGRFPLALKKGTNHILLKLRLETSASPTFTFRLDNTIKFTNHKYKYQLNGKSQLYAAD